MYVHITTYLMLLHTHIYVPQSYCISLVSGNWKHLLVATGCSRVAADDSWVLNISSIVFILWWVEGLGWLIDISSSLVNTFGTTSTNLVKQITKINIDTWPIKHFLQTEPTKTFQLNCHHNNQITFSESHQVQLSSEDDWWSTLTGPAWCAPSLTGCPLVDWPCSHTITNTIMYTWICNTQWTTCSVHKPQIYTETALEYVHFLWIIYSVNLHRFPSLMIFHSRFCPRWLQLGRGLGRTWHPYCTACCSLLPCSSVDRYATHTAMSPVMAVYTINNILL